MRRGRTIGARSPGNGGFSLVEIVVALFLVAISITAIFSGFIFQRKSSLAQNAVAEMQQNVRGAAQVLEADVRNAGYGMPAHVPYRIPPVLAGGGDSLVMVPGLGVVDGGAGGSDNVHAIYLSADATRLASTMAQASSELEVADAGGWKAGDVGIVFDDTSADFFQVTGVRASNHLRHEPQGMFAGGDLSRAYGEGSTVARIRYGGYFIDSSDSAHPTLVKNVIDPTGNLVPQVVADDIEDMQVRLVLDNGNEYDADYFLAPPGDAHANTVRKVRIYLAGRARVPDRDWSEEPKTKWNRASVVSLAPYVNHRRRSMEMLIDLRNAGIAP